jgi:hypothetical protein
VNGESFEGRLVDVRNEVATFRRSKDGHLVMHQIASFREEDRKYLESWNSQRVETAPFVSSKDKLNDLSVECKAARNSFDDNLIECELIFRGEAASRAIGYGNLVLHKALDENGNSLAPEPTTWMKNLETEISRIRVREEGNYHSDPVDGTRIELEFRTANSSMPKQLEGTIQLKIGTRKKTVVIPNLATRPVGEVASPVLKELGARVTFYRKENAIQIVTNDCSNISAIRFENPPEDRIRNSSVGGVLYRWEKTIGYRQIPDTSIFIDYELDPVLIEVPFSVEEFLPTDQELRQPRL